MTTLAGSILHVECMQPENGGSTYDAPQPWWWQALTHGVAQALLRHESKISAVYSAKPSSLPSRVPQALLGNVAM